MENNGVDIVVIELEQEPDALPTVETVDQIIGDAVVHLEQTIEQEEVEEWLKIQESIQQQTQIIAEMSRSISTLSESLIQSQATAADNYQMLVRQMTEVTARLLAKIAATDLTPPPELIPQAENPAASVVEELRETAGAEPVPTPAVPQKRKRF